MSSRIITDSSLDCIENAIADTFVLTDDNVERLYGKIMGRAKKVCVIPHGEDSKTLDTAKHVLTEMAMAGLDRHSKLTAVGGGVVGDLGGFCAAVYMRGISWTNIPTTLLAQLDSSIGGKTGVDLDGYKNMVGAFHLPKDIYICTDFLKTLPEREVRCGLGEAFKTALLEKNVRGLWDKLPKVCDSRTDLNALVKACARFKEGVVEADFKESGFRKILNLGHTVGHALEYLDDHRLSHGEYVAVGLAAEAKVGMSVGKVKEETYRYAEREARRICPEYDRLKNGFAAGEIAAAAKADKKNSGGKISVMTAEDYKTEELYFTESELRMEIEKWKSDL